MPVESPPTTRDARRLATIRAIELAGLKLLAQRGLAETTAEQIAAAAGVSVRTFFRHFPGGKGDIVVIGMRRWMAQLQTTLQARPPQEDAWAAVREASRNVPYVTGEAELSPEVSRLLHEVLNKNPELGAAVLGERQTLSEPLVAMVALRMSVDPLTDMRPRLLIETMLAAAAAVHYLWLANPTVDTGVEFDRALDYVEAGMVSMIYPFATGRSA